MPRPFFATALLGLSAAVIAGTAAWFYPWPQQVQQSGKVGQLLFDGFTPNQVWRIEISRYNSDRQSLERIQLQRKGERWVLPATADFNANNSLQIGRAINSVLDRKVLEKISDDQQDHLKNGVVDPDQFQSAAVRSGLGRRITLKDRTGNPLADLIIGFPLESAQQEALYCVRVPGEPQVYSVPFDIEALTTRFQDWVEPNLLGMRSQRNPAGPLPTSVEVEAYRLDPSRPGDPAAKFRLYRAEMGQAGQAIAVRKLEVPSGEGWEAVPGSEAQCRLLLDSVLRQIFVWTFTEVRLKAKPLSEFLRNPGNVTETKPFESLSEFGFRQTAAPGSPAEFEGAGGQLTIRLETGVKIRAWFGNLNGSIQTGTKLQRFAFLNAEVDRTALPEPAAPVAAEGGPLTDEQQRAYQRDLASWQARVKTAEELVAEYNRQFAPWYYALDDEVYQRLVPEVPALPAASGLPATPQSPAEPGTSPDSPAAAANTLQESTPEPAPNSGQPPSAEGNTSPGGGTPRGEADKPAASSGKDGAADPLSGPV